MQLRPTSYQNNNTLVNIFIYLLNIIYGVNKMNHLLNSLILEYVDNMQ